MPLGHVLMIAMEHVFGEEHIFMAAIILGMIGLIMLIIGMHTRNKAVATFWGLFSGLLIWTGWIEFAFVYYARRYGVSPLMVDGEIVTNPEYLIMPSSVGFWAVFMLFYILGDKTGCPFFSWSRKAVLVDHVAGQKLSSRSFSFVTFHETILLLWTFYLLLLFSYDEQFFGDRHPVTYIIAFGSLLWSAILFFRLLKQNNLGYAVRYAIPTVIIFWNFIEILGRWNVFEEIWTDPIQYWVEALLMLVVFAVLTILSFLNSASKTKQKTKIKATDRGELSLPPQ